MVTHGGSRFEPSNDNICPEGDKSAVGNPYKSRHPRCGWPADKNEGLKGPSRRQRVSPRLGRKGAATRPSHSSPVA